MKKETKAKIKKAVIGLVLAVPMMLSACHAKLETKNNDIVETISNYEQIENSKFDDFNNFEERKQLAEMLGCDTYINDIENDGIQVLAHNYDKPIYVYFDEDYAEKFGDQTKEVLDYFFGLAGEINENYKYEIIDDLSVVEDNDTLIKYHTFSNKDLPSFGYLIIGDVETNINGVNRRELLNNVYFCSNIYIKESLNPTGKNATYVKYYIFHETAHAFGFDDIYYSDREKKTDNVYCNTIMCNPRYLGEYSNKYFMDKFTPNDYRAFIVNVSEKGITKNEEKVKYLIDKANSYENEYYANYAENEPYVSKEINDSFDVMLDKRESGLNIQRFTVKNNKYRIQVFSPYGELLDEVKGDAIKCERSDGNSVYILKNVKLEIKNLNEEFLYNTNMLVSDFLIKQTSESEFIVETCIKSVIGYYAKDFNNEVFKDIETPIENEENLTY